MDAWAGELGQQLLTLGHRNNWPYLKTVQPANTVPLIEHIYVIDTSVFKVHSHGDGTVTAGNRTLREVISISNGRFPLGVRERAVICRCCQLPSGHLLRRLRRRFRFRQRSDESNRLETVSWDVRLLRQLYTCIRRQVHFQGWRDLERLLSDGDLSRRLV